MLFRSSSFWYDMHGQVNGKRLRELCLQPKSQHSIRPLKWRPFLESIDPAYRHNLEKVDSLNAGHDLESSDPENLKLGVQGHRVVKVRVRLGQGKFRQELRSKFGDICALSGRNHPSALDAAHLYVYASTGEHNLMEDCYFVRIYTTFSILGLLEWSLLKKESGLQIS